MTTESPDHRTRHRGQQPAVRTAAESARTPRKGLAARRPLAVMAVLGLMWALSEPGFAQVANPDEKVQRPADAATAEAVSVRYRFSEKYTTEDDPKKPWLVSQYQVGTVATKKIVVEKAQGAPERSEFTLRMRCTERAGGVNNLGDITDAVRRYDKFAIKGTGPTALEFPAALFDKLTIWYHSQAPGKPPRVVSLDENRTLRDLEYRQIWQSQIFFPALRTLLPQLPTRVGDKWPLSRLSTERLVGKLPDDDEGNLEGTLIEVKKTAADTYVALIGISGELSSEQSPRSVNAHLRFEFTQIPTTATAASGEAAAAKAKAKSGSAANAGIVEARGWITELRLAEAQTAENRNARLRSIITREIVMGRRRFTPQPGQVSGIDSPLAIPDPLPTPNEQNSWLTYEDPKGQFYFRHPQELQLSDMPTLPGAIEINDQHVNGVEAIIVWYEPKDQTSKTGRPSQNPDHYVSQFDSYWKKEKREVLPGPSGWMPDADWSPLKRRVYRREVALLGGETRLYDDFYLILFTTSKVVAVQAMTSEDAHVAFRDRVEAIIKSFTLGKPSVPAPTTAPAATDPASPTTPPASRLRVPGRSQ